MRVGAENRCAEEPRGVGLKKGFILEETDRLMEAGEADAAGSLMFMRTEIKMSLHPIRIVLILGSDFSARSPGKDRDHHKI